MILFIWLGIILLFWDIFRDWIKSELCLTLSPCFSLGVHSVCYRGTCMWKPKNNLKWLSSGAITFPFVWDLSFTCLKLSKYDTLSRQQALGPYMWSSPVLALQLCSSALACLNLLWGHNQGPHVCNASPFLTGPSPKLMSQWGMLTVGILLQMERMESIPGPSPWAASLFFYFFPQSLLYKDFLNF